jgi:hypothetical protein
MKGLFLSLLVLSFHAAIGQVSFSGGGKIIISGGGKVIIQNPIPGGITWEPGSGILTSSEADVVILGIGSQTGEFSLPFITPSGATIPFTYNIQTPGSGGSGITMSSWAVDEPGTTNIVTGGPGLPVAVNSFVIANEWGNWLVQGGSKVVNRFWSITPVGYAVKPTGEYRFTYNSTEVPAGLPESQITAQRWNDQQGTWLDWLYADVADVATKTVSVLIANPEDQFPIWVLSDISDPLPIELVDFTAACDELVEISWTTWSETQNEMFILQRAGGDLTWQTIATLAGAGTSSTQHEYGFTDDAAGPGTWYYRLIDESSDGERRVSRVIAVTCGSSSQEVIVSPNPTEGVVTIVGSRCTSVMDAIGRQVSFDRTYNGINISRLAAGIYTLRVESGEQFKVIKK